MPKSEDLSFAAIKAAANSSMPIPPVGSDRSRVGLVAAGNPDVLAEAANREPSVRLKSGPAWEEGLGNGTQVSHRPGKNDLKQLGRGRPITY
jgi:hypothetical protein